MKILAVVLVIMTITLGVIGATTRKPRACTYIAIRADSLLIASFVPPCNPQRRPDTDTVMTWRIPSQSRACTGHVIVDADVGEVRVHWADCDGVLRRAAFSNPEGS